MLPCNANQRKPPLLILHSRQLNSQLKMKTLLAKVNYRMLPCNANQRNPPLRILHSRQLKSQLKMKTLLAKVNYQMIRQIIFRRHILKIH